MKPFLGIDLTANKKNEQTNGSEFLIYEPPCILSDSPEQPDPVTTNTVDLTKIPMLLRVIRHLCTITQYASGAFALLLTAKIFIANIQGSQIPPWYYYAAGVCVLLWPFLWLWGKLRVKRILNAVDPINHIPKDFYTLMEIPADAKTVDILSFFYKSKNDSIRICEKGMQIAPYFNLSFKVYSDNEYLYLASSAGKYAFSLSSMTAIYTITEHIRISCWNKEELFNKGIYKPYKLKSDQYGCIRCNSYHILEFTHKEELWYIYIPCYELPVLEELTGLKAQAE